MSRISEAWARIAAWMKTGHAPPAGLTESFGHGAIRFSPPASAVELAALATAIGRAVPESLAESLSIHAGTSFRLAGWALLSPSEIATNWRALEKLSAEIGAVETRRQGPIAPALWKAAWIPFASDGSRCLLCIDLASELGGTAEQVIRYAGDGSPQLVAPSLASFLEDFALALERGDYVFEPFAGLVPRESD